MRGSIPTPWDRDLSWRQTINTLSPPGAPQEFLILPVTEFFLAYAHRVEQVLIFLTLTTFGYCHSGCLSLFVWKVNISLFNFFLVALAVV